ncbi:MAG: S8/S53 family peptidase, partial [Myxococcota bacterium]
AGRTQRPVADLATSYGLVFAVGGLNYQDAPLENSRPKSMPELAAPGSGVAAAGARQVLTGTSMSAMAASVTAALVWRIVGDDSADRVWQRMIEAGRRLPLSADVYYGTQPPRVHGLSVCAAQQEACAEAGCLLVECPPNIETSSRSVELFTLGSVAAFNRSGASGHTMVPSDGPSGSCGMVLTSTEATTAVPPCPLGLMPAARRLGVGPQPLDPICPACFVFAFQTGQLAVTLDVLPAGPMTMLQDVTLTIRTLEGEQARLSLQPNPMPLGFQHVLLLNTALPYNKVAEAWLQYKVTYNFQQFLVAEPLLTL